MSSGLGSQADQSLDGGFTPALGSHRLTPFYDAAIALLTRESTWRRRLADEIAPGPGDRILDIGCGTGSMTVLLKERCPEAEVTGIDPDPAVLARAAEKARGRAPGIRFIQGFADETVRDLVGPCTKIVSSLVLHQTPVEEKARILRCCHGLLRPGGALVVADYGEQRGLARLAFRVTVQMLDGAENTQPNADGILPGLIGAVGFEEVETRRQFLTPTGSIAIWRALKPARRSA